MIPDATWTLSPVSTTDTGLLQRTLSAPDGRTMLRLSGHPAAALPAPMCLAAASHTVAVAGGALVPEIHWHVLHDLQGWGNPSLLADDGRTRAFVAALFAGHARKAADTALMEAVVSAWAHLRGQASGAGGTLHVSAEGDLRARRIALTLKRRAQVRETVARGEIGLPPGLRDALQTRPWLLRIHAAVQVVRPDDPRSAHARLAHEAEVLDPLRRRLLDAARDSTSDLAPLLMPTLKRLLRQMRA
jgi:hypothetical protein